MLNCGPALSQGMVLHVGLTWSYHSDRTRKIVMSVTTVLLVGLNGGEGGGGGSICRWSANISLICRLSVKIFDLCRLSVNLS